jgi:nicotinate-nucleotide adenylyltransferase
MTEEDRQTRIGVIGGTFDPPHIGHLIAAAEVKYRLDLSDILFIPNRRPPHKTDREVTRFEDRVAMARLAIESNLSFKLDLIEIERPGLSYALDTLRLLRERFGSGTNLTFLLGIDAFLEFDTWHEPDALLAEFELAVMDRPAERSDEARRAAEWKQITERFPSVRERVTTVEVPLIGVSSGNIRRRVAKGRSIRYLVPYEVELYIRERRLYLSST